MSVASRRVVAVRPRRRRRDPRALACLLLAGALLAGALAVALAHASTRLSGTNGIGSEVVIGRLSGGSRVCQGGELLPAGTTAVRLQVPVESVRGPLLRIVLSRGGRVVARTVAATRAADFAVVAPIPRVPRDLDRIRLCYTVGPGAGLAAAIGSYAPPGTETATIDGRPTERAMQIDYLLPGARSWWSYAPTIARRMGLGRGRWAGSWTAWVAAALALAAIALAVRAVVRTLVEDEPAAGRDAADPGEPRERGPRPLRSVRRTLRRVPAVGWSVCAIAVLNALAWSLITPAFQVPDEPTHAAYVQEIGERGRPPVNRGQAELPPELTAAMVGTGFGVESARRFVPALWSPLQQRQLDRLLGAHLAQRGNGDAGPADPEPPLYYALEAVPYRLAHGASVLDRLTLMRAFSALLAGATALLVLLFVRECLPRPRWAWTVGGVGAAFVPLLGFVSGGVNPDALLFPVCAALFLGLARAFRRGMTPRRAAWIGGVLAVGVVAKINFFGLVPGALAGVALAARASEQRWNARVARAVGIAAGIGLAAYVLLSLLDALAWERTLILARTHGAAPQDVGGLGAQLSYLWQLFLPRLPGERVYFPEFSPLYYLWVEGFVGRFGWVTAEFPAWAYRLAAGVLAGIALLALRAGVVERAALRRRRAELAAFALMAGGLLLLIAMVALRGWAPGIKGAVQGRYLLPLLPLFGALLAFAPRAVGERWGRAAGVAIVVLAIGWSVFAQLVTIAYFYA